MNTIDHLKEFWLSVKTTRLRNEDLEPLAMKMGRDVEDVAIMLEEVSEDLTMKEVFAFCRYLNIDVSYFFGITHEELPPKLTLEDFESRLSSKTKKKFAKVRLSELTMDKSDIEYFWEMLFRGRK